MAAERLQKIIAAAGIASRRKAEELITQGRVSVNGHTITELGSKADLDSDHIKVDGKLLRGAQRHVYRLLNKPRGYVTTVSDPEGRPTVMDLVKNVSARIYPVGRLDWASEGLLLLTNDGDLASKLTRAASHVPKTYLVKIAGRATEDEIEKLRRGIRIGAQPGERRPRPGAGKNGVSGELKQVFTAPAQVRLMKDAANPWYEVTLIEGKNRQIRRMFEEIGRHVEKIRRVRYGPLTLDVEPGESRELAPAEVSALRKSVRERTAKPLPPKAAHGERKRGNAKRNRRQR
jgi:23S rRNA pseudouridine2605 synthase